MLLLRQLSSLLMTVVMGITASSIQLTSSNIKEVLGGSELVLVNFYADWCHFSQMLKPIFDEAATEIRRKFTEEKVTLAKVDCDRETGIATEYSVSKYPTVKLFRSGLPVKREYRGQRSVSSLVQFVEEQSKESLNVLTSADALNTVEESQRHFVGYFGSETSPEFIVYRKVASSLRESCKFSAVVGANAGENKIEFRPPKMSRGHEMFESQLTDYTAVMEFVTPRCIPFVREITFENAEELTEEGLPFLILFHHPDDKNTVETFQAEAQTQLAGFKNSINILTANGLTFTHPLHHLGKTSKDLPLLAIDSFRHMYVWPHDPRNDLRNGNLLSQFVADLQSGKLHREFHYGPDKTQQSVEGANNDASSPPSSVFRLLGPSGNRYTILGPRDEL